MNNFKLMSEFKPSDDQKRAINGLCEGLCDGLREQVLLGVTGSGKTFTMANVIAKVNRPTLVITHNKTLAAQLCNEFREFFPENRVEYFVSYYDYYQPEAYIPKSDTYIEKDLQINDEIDRLRNSATASLCERRDVIVVASVSCIYGLGAPVSYFNMAISIRPGDKILREDLIMKLIDIQYKRNDLSFERNTFRVRGDALEIYPSNSYKKGIRIDFFDDEIDRIVEFDPISSKALSILEHAYIFPASHYVIEQNGIDHTLEIIKGDLKKRIDFFQNEDKLIEAQRISERVNYDIEMIKEIGYCSGIENYSRYFDGRTEGETPYTLLDFFPDDFITFVDESHMTLPQLRAMYNGDLSRKKNLVDFGFRLPAAYDNRPLRFEEFDSKIGQLICVSATPAKYELDNADNIVEQILRPTGLLDPEVTVRPVEGQIDDIQRELDLCIKSDGRALITTLTKKMAESLTEYLVKRKYKAKYMHSDIDTLERVELITALRKGEIDIIVGINFLREGLDIPEVQLVVILDADKEGFLRSRTSLIQTIGRAARNADARVIMYADNITDSMKAAISETKRRREIQAEYNRKNNIIPQTIKKAIKNTLEISKKLEKDNIKNKNTVKDRIKELENAMNIAAQSLDFELAIKYRDELNILRRSQRSDKYE